MSFLSRVARFFGGGTSSRAPGTQDGTPGSGRLTTRPVTPDTAMQLSAVFAACRLIAETIASLPLHFYKRLLDGTRMEDVKHPLFRLLAYKPNRYQTRVEFWETVVWQLALHGNAYILIQRNTRKEIIGLLPMMSPQVEVVLLDDKSLVYRYYDGRNVAVYSSDSVWHIKLFGNGVIGLSPMDHARNTLGIAISAEDRVSRMANNGFKPAGVLMLDKLLTPKQRDQIRGAFSDLVEGGDDALRVLEAGMTYQQVSINPKDAQLMETRRFQIEDIARFFGVPSVLINDTTATTAWGSGIEQIVQGFYKLTIRPYLERIECSLSVWLLSIDERWLVEAEFDFSALERANGAARFQMYKEAVQSGLKTINECRRLEGDPPVDGGDKCYMQGQMTPIEKLKDGPVQPKGKINEPAQTA